MRHDKLIIALLLAGSGCSVSNDDAAAFGPEDASEAPIGVGELVGEPDPIRDGGGYGILLFDTTSSMTTTRSSTGNTRCYDAKIMAQGIINDFFDPDGTDGDGIAIFGFTNNPSASDDVQPTTNGYYTDADSAITAVSNLSCAGSTPLADALCKGVNGDGETFTLDPALDMAFILTDGFENNSDGPCSGSSGSVTTAGTWQYKVAQEMVATGIRIDTRYWIDPTLLLQPESIDDFAVGDDPYDPAEQELEIVTEIEGVPPVPTIDQFKVGGNTSENTLNQACDTSCQELHLFKHLALVSGGTWGVVEDDDPGYPNAATTDPVTGPVQPTLEDDNAPPPAEETANGV